MGHGVNAGQWRHKNSWLAACFLEVSCATVGGLRRTEQRDITSVRRGREAEMECSMFAAAAADQDSSPRHRFSFLSYPVSLDLSAPPLHLSFTVFLCLCLQPQFCLPFYSSFHHSCLHTRTLLSSPSSPMRWPCVIDEAGFR